MADLTFELGFDWNMPSSENALGVVYALQMYLVKNDPDPNKSAVISPCNSSKINTGDTLGFRIYDFTGSPSAPAGTEPRALQVLFATAVDQQPANISPILVAGKALPQLATTDFGVPQQNPTSIAYGDVARGWDVTTLLPLSELRLSESGRFEMRAMLTVSVPGQMARFYRVDPEMVVGGSGTPGSLGRTA
jgi:hypothetical protein